MPTRPLLLLCVTLIAACAAGNTTPPRSGGGFHPAQLAKSDIDRVAEAHQREIFIGLRVLTEKLYRRNLAILLNVNTDSART